MTRTYHPILKWRCTKCEVADELLTAPNDYVDVVWERVLRAHLEKSPACKGGEAGIVVQREVMSLAG